jgi:hypothetical protein
MTITEAISRLRKYAEELNIDLSEYDDEDLIIRAINFFSHNIVDIFDEELHG